MFVGVHWLSPVAASEGRSLVAVPGRLIAAAALSQSTASRRAGSGAAGSRAQAQSLWHTGLGAPTRVES